ncbi:MAG: glycosyltransferase, partial [Selenomonadaceae bacterium]|nr:glycosyltransferase [Selenomonadaceae bacterium]
MEAKKLSIIVTACNAGLTVSHCLDSVLSCSYRNLEVIVVNDASEDDTGTVVRSLMKADRRIKYVELQEHAGKFHARMLGAEHSDGDYVAFLDGDAWISCDFYRRTIQRAEEAEADLVMGELLFSCGKEHYRYGNHWQCRISELGLPGTEMGRIFLEAQGQDRSLEILCNKVCSRALWDRCFPFLHLQEDVMEQQDVMVFSMLFFSFAEYVVNIHGDFVCCLGEECALGEERRHAFLFLRRLFRKEPEASWALDGLDAWEKNLLEEGKEPQHLFTEISGLPYESIKRKILSDSIAVVSFDVFDTLVVRPFYVPTDLFDFLDFYVRDLMGWPDRIGFKERRIEAEQMARERFCGGRDGSEDVTLREIYGVLGELLPLTEEQLELVERREIELELKYCRPRQSAKELFELACYVGKTVVAASDMYLPLPVIEELLALNHYDGICCVFLSNDVGRAKWTGGLYGCMAEQLGVEPGCILHIGDNREADVRQAREAGLEAAYFPRCVDLLMSAVDGVYSGEAFQRIYQGTFGMRRGGDFRRFLGMRILLGMVANRIFDNPFPQFHVESDFNADPRIIGYGVLGPHLFAIADWLIRETERNGYRNLNFMARDGYLPMKAFEIFQ